MISWREEQEASPGSSSCTPRPDEGEWRTWPAPRQRTSHIENIQNSNTNIYLLMLWHLLDHLTESSHIALVSAEDTYY